MFFVFAVMVAVTKLTDADLTDQENVPENGFFATTLDFVNQNTANNTPKSLLFSISGLVPGGFQVETVRIFRKGQLGFAYQVTPENFAGDMILCQALEIMVLNNWQTQFEGKLTDLSYQGEIANDQVKDDLVLVLKLTDANQALAAKSCVFDLKIQTVNDEEGSSFSDEEVLTNQVNTAVNW